MAKKSRNPYLFSGLIIVAVVAILYFGTVFFVLFPNNPQPVHWHEIHQGEYVSGNISLSNSSLLFIYAPSNSSDYALIPSASLGYVGIGNVSNYSVSPDPNNTVTFGSDSYSLSGNGSLYSGLSGEFTIVSFANSAPALMHLTSKASPNSFYSIFSTIIFLLFLYLIGLIGFILIIVGAAMVISGRIRKRKQ